MKLYGDGLKVLLTFMDYATRDDNLEIADAMYYEPDELRRRVLELKRQLEEMEGGD